jgi:hypothetical protein
VLAPTRDGAGLTGTLFRSRLRRALVAAATADKSGTVRQRRIRERVGVFGQVFDDGTGSLTVVIDAEKIAAALDRADAAARAARAQGDPRTLDALRADFMTGAAIHGWPGGTGCITGCGNASGGVGIGRGEPSEAGSADRRGTGSKDGRGGSGDGSGNPRGAGSVVRGRDGRGDRSGDRNGPASGDERQAGRGDGLADRIGDGNGNGRGDGRGDGSGDGSGDLRWDGRGETGFGFAPAPAGRVFVVVPWSTAAGLDDAPCELPGHGWVTAEHARRIITTDGSIWQTLLADPDTGRALSLSAKGYRPTRAIVEHVRAVDGICRGPGCQRPARQCDLDHDRTWPDGPTDVDNLTAKHRAHHRVRTAGWWTADRDEDAILTWRTAAGRTYITRPKDWLDGHRPTEPATAPDVARTHPPPSDESPGRPPGLPSGESPGQWSASSAVESSGPSGGQSSQPSAVQPRPRSAGGAAATHDPPPF